MNTARTATINKAFAVIVSLGSCVLLFTIACRPVAVTNQYRLIRILREAEPIWSVTLPHTIIGVRSRDQVRLRPDVYQVVDGYKVDLQVIGASDFTLLATPVAVGRTGLYSFFRDAKGNLRFEETLGMSASPSSRFWRQDE